MYTWGRRRYSSTHWGDQQDQGFPGIGQGVLKKGQHRGQARGTVFEHLAGGATAWKSENTRRKKILMHLEEHGFKLQQIAYIAIQYNRKDQQQITTKVDNINSSGTK
jgi:hypothetical protein